MLRDQVTKKPVRYHTDIKNYYVNQLNCCLRSLETENYFQQVYASPVLRTPHLDAVLQVMPQQHGIERQDHHP